MQRELLWFKEVEKIIQPLFKEIKDSEGRTPQMLFTEEHKGLAKGEKWLKNTASSCMLVATLLSFSLFPTPQPFSLPLSHLSIASHPLLFSLVSLRPPNLPPNQSQKNDDLEPVHRWIIVKFDYHVRNTIPSILTVGNFDIMSELREKSFAL
ncbi:hypothetical protein GYH30_042535 [Glycine max]|nr:hypothetical protein GYH30_042535 [Glycine max]